LSAAGAVGVAGRPVWTRWADRAFEALDRDRTCWVVLGVAMVAYAVLALYLIRGTTLFVDGLDLFLNNRGLDLGALFRPLNGHLVLMERSVYAAGFALFGAGSVVFRLVEVAGTLLAVGLLFELLKRRLGNAAALAPAVLVLFLGISWEVTIVPDVMTNTFCAAAGLGAWLALDRHDRRGDVAACLLLVASICCWTLGVAFAIGAGVRIALERGPRHRLLVPAAPVALYAIWWIWVRVWFVPAHGGVPAASLSNALTIPGFVAGEAASVTAGVAGLGRNFTTTDPLSVLAIDSSLGYPLAVIAAVAVVYVIRRRGARPALWGALVALVSFWAALAVSFAEGRTPTTARYVYPGAVLALIVAAEALPGVRMSRRALLALYGVAVFALGSNVYRLGEGARFFRNYSADQRAQWTAIEIAGNRADPGYRVHEFLTPVLAGPYLDAVERNGSPAYTPTALAAQPENFRESADGALVGALRIHLTPAARAQVVGGCHLLRPPSPGAPATAVVDAPNTLFLRSRSTAQVALRRFASTNTVGIGSLRPEQLTALRLPADGYGSPWYVSVGPAQAPVSVCGAG
jgi:hypothetical protein